VESSTGNQQKSFILFVYFRTPNLEQSDDDQNDVEDDQVRTAAVIKGILFAYEEQEVLICSQDVILVIGDFNTDPDRHIKSFTELIKG